MGRRVKICLIVLMPVAFFATGFLPFSDMPAQPIDFSHRIHAGENGIPCLYCHTGARRSPVSGIPSVERCMGCHKIIAADKPEILKLKGYYDKGESVEWVRIFLLPDFVFFNHEPHVTVGVECQTCHGAVENTDRFRTMPDLKMGWCLGCHREKNAPVDCFICHR